MQDAECWKIESRKYDDSLHRLWTCCRPVPVGPLPRGAGPAPAAAFLIPARTVVREKSGQEWSSDYQVVAYFFAGVHFQVMALCKESGREFYCNSCTPPELDKIRRVVRYVDMDLDVLVDRFFSARVLDRTEFVENTVKFGYPQALVDRVQEDLRGLLKAIRLRRGVFSAQMNPCVEQDGVDTGL